MLTVLTRPFFLLPKTFQLFGFQSFEIDRTWWRLFQKCVMRTKLDMYVSIHCMVFRLTTFDCLFSIFKLFIHIKDFIRGRSCLRFAITLVTRVAHRFSFLSCVVVLRIVYLRPVSCVPNVSSVSGLYILDFPFRFL